MLKKQEQLGLRVDDQIIARLDKLVAKLGTDVTSRHSLAKNALTIGLGILEKKFAHIEPSNG